VSYDDADVGRIQSLACAAYTVPTDRPESDGTLEWESTTIVAVHVNGGGHVGVGYSYTDAAAVPLIEHMLTRVVVGKEIAGTGRIWAAMVATVRNIAGPGAPSSTSRSRPATILCWRV